MKGVLPPLCLLLLGSCSSVDDDVGSELSHAYVLAACGPTDGPAFQVFITKGRVGCNGLPEWAVGQPPEKSFVMIYVLGTMEPAVPSTFTVGPDAEPPFTDFEGAWASHCGTGVDFVVCATAINGRITFGRGDREGDVIISFELEFDDDSHISGAFPLRNCEQQAICG